MTLRFYKIWQGMILCGLVWPGASWASAEVAHGASHGPTLKFLFAIINFLIFVGILIWAGRKKVVAFFQERSQALKKEIQTARRTHQEAVKQLNHMEEKLSQIDHAITALNKEIIASGNSMREAILKEAEAITRRVASDTERMIQQKLKAHEAAFKAKLLEEAVAQARRYLAQHFGIEHARQWTQQCISELEGGPNGR